jgi:hypothetical protein
MEIDKSKKMPLLWSTFFHNDGYNTYLLKCPACKERSIASCDVL